MVLFMAGFLLFLQVMIGFVKNSLRRRALKGVKMFGGCRQVFPQMGALKRVGVLCKVDNIADVQAFEELVQFLSGEGNLQDAVRAAGMDVQGAGMDVQDAGCGAWARMSGTGFQLYGMVVEGKKCFKDNAARESFVAFCKGAGFEFLPKGATDWKGVPDQEYVKVVSDTELDLLISLNPCDDFTLEYFALVCPSHFTTGVHPDGPVPYSLVLEPGEGSLTFKEYVGRLMEYLQNMQQ